jgi:UDP-N-acetylglucosamine 2-epimerase (non-hydrolysing)
MHKSLVIFGTRPEIIKLGPVYRALDQREDIIVHSCWSGQHIELADGLLELFEINVDHSCSDIVRQTSLSGKTGSMLHFLGDLLSRERYDSIVVQGDTITAMAGAIAGFLHRIPVAHVEAGLRTHDIMSPWPEEFSRRVISIAGMNHYAPTEASALNLRNEGIAAKNIVVTGNTVVDAVKFVRKKLSRGYQPHSKEILNLPEDKKLILVTGHRRENIGEPFLRILKALQKIAEDGDKFLLFPVHLNPNVKAAVYDHLGNSPNIRLVAPLRYPDFIYLLEKAFTVITDSGGIQEEAPCFKIPIIITRETTERPEVIQAGFGKLVGSNTNEIVDWARMLTEAREPIRLPFENPFGDGMAANQIATDIAGDRWHSTESPEEMQISLF